MKTGNLLKINLELASHGAVSKVCVMKGRKGSIFCKCSSLLPIEHLLL
jgi:hypothetical protein